MEKNRARMEWLFYHHQISILNQDRSMARKYLEEYMNLAFKHMEEEEKYLIPVYEERVEEI